MKDKLHSYVPAAKELAKNSTIHIFLQGWPAVAAIAVTTIPAAVISIVFYTCCKG